jgi:hypothetical protein
MSAELIFSLCNSLVLPGWLLLVVAPRWKWTLGVICAGVIPFALALVYASLMLVHLPNMPEGGGIGSLDAVLLAFGNPYVLTAGWIHYLAFDLFIGSWELRDSQNHGIPHWQLVPCLLLTFAFGPVGLGLYFILRSFRTRKLEIYPPLTPQV